MVKDPSFVFSSVSRGTEKVWIMCHWWWWRHHPSLHTAVTELSALHTGEASSVASLNQLNCLLGPLLGLTTQLGMTSPNPESLDVLEEG